MKTGRHKGRAGRAPLRRRMWIWVSEPSFCISVSRLRRNCQDGVNISSVRSGAGRWRGRGTWREETESEVKMERTKRLGVGEPQEESLGPQNFLCLETWVWREGRREDISIS